MTKAGEESEQLGDAAIGPEHILLGLLSEPLGLAAVVLEDMGMRLRDARSELRRLREAEGNQAR